MKKKIRSMDSLYTYFTAYEALKEALSHFDDSSILYNTLLTLFEERITPVIEAEQKGVLPMFDDSYDDELTFKMDNCKYDVHMNVLKKPFSSLKGDRMGYFYASNGSELVLNRWTKAYNYSNIFIVHPYAHIFDQLFTALSRSYPDILQTFESNNKLSRFQRFLFENNLFKMQKTAFRLKVLCENVVPELTINKLFSKIKCFDGTVESFDLKYQEKEKRKNRITKETFLEAVGDLTVVQYCEKLLKPFENVCSKLSNWKKYSLKF